MASIAEAHLAEVHAALLRDGALQFMLPKAAAPAADSAPWHPSLGFGSVGIVWVLAGLGTAAAVALMIAHLRGRPLAPAEPDASPLPGLPAVAPAAARRTLGDADDLAARGLHLDGARALLACGLATIAERHPGLLRPTSTSRDIARDAALPKPLRLGFARIARTVELGLFGGRPVGADDYAACRSAFVAAALSRIPWAGPRDPACLSPEEKQTFVGEPTTVRLGGRG